MVISKILSKGARRLLTRSGDDGHAQAGAKAEGDNLGIAQPPLQIQASSGALPDVRGGFKHVPRVRLYTLLAVRGTCGNRTTLTRRLNHYTKQVPVPPHIKSRILRDLYTQSLPAGFSDFPGHRRA